MSDAGPRVSPFEQREQVRRERARAHISRRRERGLRGGGGSGAERLAAAVVLLSLIAGVSAARALARGDRPLDRVTVLGAEKLSAEEVLRGSGVARGVSLAELDVGAIEAQLERHPRVATARALVASGQLLMQVEERVAVATAVPQGDPGAAPLAVDAGGRAFAPATPEERQALPQLRVAAALRLGEVDPELARGADLALRVTRQGLTPLEAIEVAASDDPAGLALRLRGVAPRFVLGRGHPDAALARLKTLLDARLPELESTREIDLRYADQAVLRSPPPDAAEAPPGGAPS